MSTVVNVDGLGRLVIPKAIRRKLNVEKGGPVKLELVGGHLEIKPAETPEARLRKIGSFLVIDDGEPFDAVVAVRKAREER